MLGDDVVLTYDENGVLTNAYGSAEQLSKTTNGEPCKNVVVTEEDAIQKAKDEDGKKYGEGNYRPLFRNTTNLKLFKNFKTLYAALHTIT